MLLKQVQSGNMIVDRVDRTSNLAIQGIEVTFSLREIPTGGSGLMTQGEQEFIDIGREALFSPGQNVQCQNIDIQYEFPALTFLGKAIPPKRPKGTMVATVEFVTLAFGHGYGHGIPTPPGVGMNFQQASQQFFAAFKSIQQSGSLFDPEPLKDLGLSIEPIVGFRDWQLSRTQFGVFLMSRNQVAWPHRAKLAGQCGESVLAAHDAPYEGCNCGIYAFNKTVEGQKMWYRSSGEVAAHVFGTVHLWGEILIGPMGFRAEFAYPKELFLRDNDTRRVNLVADELREAYGTPVTVVSDPLTASMGDTLEELRGGESQ